MFLYSGVVQLFTNLFLQIRMGLFLERKWGILKSTTIYVVTGFGGILTSCLAQPNTVAVGASAPMMGFLGAYSSQMVITWHTMDRWQKRSGIILITLFVIVTMLESIGPNYVDVTLNAGSFVIGLFAGHYFFGREYARREAIICRIFPFASLAIILTYYISGLTLFFTFIPVVHS